MHACSSVLETREKQDKVYLLDESVLPVTEKERRGKEKKSIGPRMKNGHANLDSFCSQTNGRCSVINFSLNCMYALFILRIGKTTFILI